MLDQETVRDAIQERAKDIAAARDGVTYWESYIANRRGELANYELELSDARRRLARAEATMDALVQASKGPEPVQEQATEVPLSDLGCSFFFYPFPKGWTDDQIERVSKQILALMGN